MKSNVEWKLWGKADPLYGVASWPGREKDGGNPWTDEEFYHLGEDWHDFKAAWQRSVGFQPSSVLEIGSGAGRITRMLASEFEQVIATDVSPDVLEYARTRVSNTNISWVLSDGDSIPAAPQSVDAVFSCHVFQHFPSNAAQRLKFSEVGRVLKHGGTFFVHMSIHIFPQVNGPFSRMARAAYSMFVRLYTARAVLRRLMMRMGFKRYMHGVSYEAHALLADLKEIGLEDLSISAFSVRTSGAIHCSISGRRA